MRNINFGKAGIIGVASMVVLLLVLLLVPGLAAEDVDNLKIDVNDLTCNMLNADGTDTISVNANKIKTVETSSIDGKLVYKCISEPGAIYNATGSAIQFSHPNPAVSCFIPYSGGTVITIDWHQEISSGGEDNLGSATLTCKYSLN